MAKGSSLRGGTMGGFGPLLLTHDSPHEVAAFTVDRDYLQGTEHRGLPVVAFEDVEERYPPGEFEMFVPIQLQADEPLAGGEVRRGERERLRLGELRLAPRPPRGPISRVERTVSSSRTILCSRSWRSGTMW